MPKEVQFNVRLPEQLAKKCRKERARANITFERFMSSAIEHWLAHLPSERDPFYSPALKAKKF